MSSQSKRHAHGMRPKNAGVLTPERLAGKCRVFDWLDGSILAQGRAVLLDYRAWLTIQHPPFPGLDTRRRIVPATVKRYLRPSVFVCAKT